MFDFWENDLSEEKTAELLEKCASEIRKRKLEVPSILFLESHAPLANVGAHFGVSVAPFLVPLFGFDFVNDYTGLLRKRDNVEALIKMLEEPQNLNEVSETAVDADSHIQVDSDSPVPDDITDPSVTSINPSSTS